MKSNTTAARSSYSLRSAGFLFSLAIGCFIPFFAHAQDGKLPGPSAVPASGPEWYAINPEAWHSFRSFDSERILGKWDQQEWYFKVQFESEYVVWGRKVAQQTWIPSIEQRGPLFGGEGYIIVDAVLPMDTENADFLGIKGGWKYALTPVVNIDVGGDFVYINSEVMGPGIPAAFGDKELGPLYIGLIGNCPVFTPSVYFIYEPVLRQTIVLGGIVHTWETPVEGLAVSASAQLGWLDADRWQGDTVAPAGGNLAIDYIYWELSADLRYEVCGHFVASIGVRYSGNDGDDHETLGGIDLGPNQQIWFGTEWSFPF